MEQLVLVVEDEPSLNRAMEALLVGLGVPAICFGSAEEALGSSCLWINRCCCAFVDVTLPGASGLDLAHWLRDRVPQLPIVLTSGLEGVWCLAALEPVRYMTKPFGLQQIAQALDWSSTCLLNSAQKGREVAS